MSPMPQVSARELTRFLKSQGFVEDRQAGSHLTLWHEETLGSRLKITSACDERRICLQT